MKRTELQALIAQKCPRCRQGNMFESNTYSFTTFNPIKRCTHCGLDFDIEPGFFTGAMYFSYAINVAIIAFMGVMLNIFFELNIYVLMSIVLSVVTLLIPFNFRYSRMLMMYMFSGIKYDPALD